MSLRPRVVAVIPARNEEPTVASVVRDVQRVLECEVVVVDDASTDQTAAEATRAGATVLRLPFNMGAWGAAQAGIRYANSHGFTTVVTLDADGQHHAESIPKLLECLRENHLDVVIGACPDRLSLAKRIAWGYFRWLTRLGLHDFTSGLRAYGPRAVSILASRQASLLDYQDVGVLLLLNRRDMQMQEIPVSMSPRKAGHSRVFSSWYTVGLYMLQTTVLCLSRFDTSRARAEGVTRS